MTLNVLTFDPLAKKHCARLKGEVDQTVPTFINALVSMLEHGQSINSRITREQFESRIVHLLEEFYTTYEETFGAKA